MKTLFSLLVLLLISTSVHADNWNKTDKILAGTFLAAAAIDYVQTNHAIHSDNHHEMLGIKDDATQFAVMGGLTALFFVIADRCPKIRHRMLVGANIVEWGIVGFNFGIRIPF